MEVLVVSLDPFERLARLVNPTYIKRINIDLKETPIASSSHLIRNQMYMTKAKEANASARVAFKRPNIPSNYKVAINDPIYSIEWKVVVQDKLEKLVSMGIFTVVLGALKSRRRIGCH
jgi:hypothetical protein